MKKRFDKIFVIFLSLFFASCSINKNDQPSKIRIVDLQGRSHPVITRTPELNVQALALQHKQQLSQNNYQNFQAAQDTNLPIANSSENFLKPSSAGENIPNQNQPNQNPSSIGAGAGSDMVYLEDPGQYGSQGKTSAYQNSKTPATGYGEFSANEVQKTFQAKSDKPQPNQDNQNFSPQAVVEYDMSSSEADNAKDQQVERSKSFSKKSASAKKAQTSAVLYAKQIKGIFVQVGSFSVKKNAQQTLEEMNKFYLGTIETTDGNKAVHRVLLGPFANKAKAQAMIKKISASGHEAILVRK